MAGAGFVAAFWAGMASAFSLMVARSASSPTLSPSFATISSSTPEAVAGTIDSYVSLAVRLARDTDFRAALKTRVAEDRHRLYRDRASITALEDFIDLITRIDGHPVQGTPIDDAIKRMRGDHEALGETIGGEPYVADLARMPPISISAASSFANARRCRPPSTNAMTTGFWAGTPAARAGISTFICTTAPAPISAARKPRCWKAWKARKSCRA